MDFKKITAAVLLIVGIILVIYGFTQFNSLESQFTRAIGQKDNSTVGCIVGGAVSAILGLYLMLRKR